MIEITLSTRGLHVEVSYNPRTCTYSIRSLYVFCTCNGRVFQSQADLVLNDKAANKLSECEV